MAVVLAIRESMDQVLGSQLDALLLLCKQTEAVLVGYSDSDWQVAHSTSAHAILFGDACVCYGSRRQHCVAMSSTEAEIITA